MRLPLSGSDRLRRIVTAYTVNQLGTWFGYVALSLGVYDHTHSPAAVSGLFLAARLVPALLAPPLVARVEASRRRASLSVLYWSEGIAAAALGGLLLHFWLPAILVLVAVDGTAALAANALLRAEAARPDGRPAVDGQGLGEGSGATAEGSGAITEGSGANEEGGGANEERWAHRANAALNTALAVSVVMGPVLGGVVVVAAGLATAMFIDAVSFVACGALLIGLQPHVQEEASRASVMARLRAAWDHLREVPQLRGLLIAQATAFVFFEAATPVEVFYAKSTLRVGDGGYGLLLSVWGIGMVLGSLVFARLKQRALAKMLIAGTLAVGMAYIGLAAAPTLALACVAAVVGGTGNGVQWASLLGSVQTLTPARLRGRVMGAVESIGALAPAVGLWLGGALIALISPRGAFLIAGLGASATTLLFWRVLRAGLTPAPLRPASQAASTEGDAVPGGGERAPNLSA